MLPEKVGGPSFEELKPWLGHKPMFRDTQQAGAGGNEHPYLEM
jgi:hypothetical protein